MDSSKSRLNQLSVKLKFVKEGHTYTGCFNGNVTASL